MSNNHQIINIYWTRHAESCANYHTNVYEDKPPKNYTDTSNIGREKVIKGGSIVDVVKGFCSYHPPLSYIGIQQAIKLSEEISKFDFKFDFVLCSPLLRTIMTSQLAFRNYPDTKIQVVPFINEEINMCNGFDYQNNIPNLDILKRMTNYSTEWMKSEKFKYYDDILLIDKLQELASKTDHIYISSGLTKYVTGILKYSLNTTKQDNSSLQPLKNKYGYIYALKMLIGDILNKHADELLNDKNNYDVNKLFTENTFDVLKDIDLKGGNDDKLIELYKLLSSDDNNNNTVLKELLGYYFYFDHYITNNNLPEIDFNIIQPIKQQNGKFITGWKIDGELYGVDPHFDKFFDITLPELISTIGIDKPINIFVATHGSALTKYFELQKRPKNTQMLRMECVVIKQDDGFKIFKSTNTTITNYYDPDFIRQTYKNFEILNPDICTNNAIKGVVNSKEIKGVGTIKDKITVGLKKFTLNDDLL